MFSSVKIPVPLPAGSSTFGQSPPGSGMVGSTTIAQPSPSPDALSVSQDSRLFLSLLKKTLTTNSPADIKGLSVEVQKRFKNPCSLPSGVSRVLLDFLEVLLLCYSGEYAVDPTTVIEVKGETEAQHSLHTAVASIACPAASSLVQYLKQQLTITSEAPSTCVSNIFFSPSSSASSSSADMMSMQENGSVVAHRSRVSSHHPLLLSAQCLYLLSRHFSMTAPWLNDIMDVVLELLIQIQKGWRCVLPINTFVQGHGTSAAITTLTWLLIFSIGNAIAPWQRKRMVSGKMLGENSLVYESHNHTPLRNTFSKAFTKLSSDLMEMGVRGVGKRWIPSSSSKTSFPTVLVPVVDGFISILYLQFGCLLRALKDEVGYDYAMAAFTGDGGVEIQQFSGAKGKVAKRMVQLAPNSTALLYIPVEKIFVAPYEVLSFLADDMLPLIHHLSKMEQESLQVYLDQLVRLEESNEFPMLPPLMEGGSEVGNIGGFSSRFDIMGDAGVLRHHPSTQQVGGGFGDGGPGLHASLQWVNTSSDPLATLTPFTSWMSHIVEALTVCLRELPPSYLDPDLESDCAATWFIFKNVFKHMSEALSRVCQAAYVSGTSRWDNYAYKLVSRFMDVLTMIGRQAPYIERIAHLLAGAQSECAEIEWPQLVQQALICVGFYSSGEGQMDSREKQGELPHTGSRKYNTELNPGRVAAAGRQNPGRGVEGSLVPLSALAGHYSVGKLQCLHRQFTEAYARKCQQRYISSFFLLLRQLLLHPSLRPVVQAYMTLPLALSFLFASQQSPETLGSVLSLVSSMIFSREDAVMVWEFLEKHQLLGAISVIPGAAAAAASSTTISSSNISPVPGTGDQEGMEEGVRPPLQQWKSNASSLSPQERTSFFSYSKTPPEEMASPLYPVASGEKTMNLLAHCQYEKSQGKFPITIGFLNLVIALFRYDPTPASTRGAIYHTVTHVVSQEIFCGLCRRSFVDPRERYTVMALGAAALRQALLVQFDSPFVSSSSTTRTTTTSMGPATTTATTTSSSSSCCCTPAGTSTGSSSTRVPPGQRHHGGKISFATVMAHNLAPTDVVGEVQSAIDMVLSSSSEILSHQRASIRECLQLVHTAVHVAEEGKLHLFSLDVRTTQSPSLASKLLLLSQSSQDLLLSKAALELLLLFPTDIIAEASQYWHVQADSLAMTIKSFTELLHPLAVVPPTAEVEPALAILSASFLDESASYCRPLSATGDGRGGNGHRKSSTVPPTNDPILQEVKALLLHLLTIHAHATEPSLTAWVCGFQVGKHGSYGNGITPAPFLESSSPGSPSKTDACSPVSRPSSNTNSALHSSSSSLLSSILLGATSVDVETNHPSLAVKYVKLLYVLRSSRLYGETVMRQFLAARGAPLFLRLLQWEPTSGDPMLMSKYAYVIQLLTLEVLFVYQHAPNQLCMPFNTLPSIPIEVALSLLHPQQEDAMGVSYPPRSQTHGRGTEAGQSNVDPFIGSSSSAAGTKEIVNGNDSQDDIQLLSRSATPDIAQWLIRVLRHLPIFPSDLGLLSVSTVLSPHGDSFLVKATDQILQYDIAALFEAMQMEPAQEMEAGAVENENPQERQKSRSTLSTAALRARLAPYVEANKCFLINACAENFITSLCQFISLTSCTVEGIPVDRLQSFAFTVLSALELTSVLTVASQEKVSYRLCHLLPTIITKLHMLAADDGEGTIVTKGLSNSSNGRRSGGGKTKERIEYTRGRLRAPLGEKERGMVPVTSSMYLHSASPGRISKRKGRANDLPIPFGGTSPFSTVAGNTSNVLHIYRGIGREGSSDDDEAEKDVLTGGNMGEVGSYLRKEECGGGREPGNIWRLNAHSLNRYHTLLPPVMEALIRWGPRLPCVRVDLYHSLVLLSVLPGVLLDECLVLYRGRDALLQLLVEEICQPYHLEARYHALILLVQLVQSSKTLCRTFVCAREEGKPGCGMGTHKNEEENGYGGSTSRSTPGLGPLAMRCFNALFTAVDRCTLDLTTHTSTSLGYGNGSISGGPTGESARLMSDLRSTQLLIRATFDLLRLVSVHHTPALLQGNVLLHCMRMNVWTRSAQIVLGHAVVASQRASGGTAMDIRDSGVETRSDQPSFPASSSQQQHHHQLQQEQLQQFQVLKRGQEAARTLFLMTMRWINIMLASALGGTSPVLVEQVRHFLAQRRPLVDFFLRLPISFHASGNAPLNSSSPCTSSGTICVDSSRPSSPFPSPFPFSNTPATNFCGKVGGDGNLSTSPTAVGTSCSAGEEDLIEGCGWSSLSLYVELSSLLRALASSPLAVEECRRLAVELAIPQLLLTFSQGIPVPGIRMCGIGKEGGSSSRNSFGSITGEDGLGAGELQSSPPQSPSCVENRRVSVINLFSVDYRRWVVLYNLSDFLLRCEYGRRGDVEEEAQRVEIRNNGQNASNNNNNQKNQNNNNNIGTSSSDDTVAGMQSTTTNTEGREGTGAGSAAAASSLLSTSNVIRHRPHDMECILFAIENLSNQCLGSRAPLSQRGGSTSFRRTPSPQKSNSKFQDELPCMLVEETGGNASSKGAAEDCSSALPLTSVLECYVFTLHSLVCLLQSLVLPLCDTSCVSCGHNFPLYLQSLNLGRYAAVLRRAQQAVQHRFPFYTCTAGEEKDGTSHFHATFQIHDRDWLREDRGNGKGGNNNTDLDGGSAIWMAPSSNSAPGSNAGVGGEEGQGVVSTSQTSSPPTPHMEMLSAPSSGKNGAANVSGSHVSTYGSGAPSHNNAVMWSAPASRSRLMKENGTSMELAAVNRKRRLGDYFPQHDATSLLREGISSKGLSHLFGAENAIPWYRPISSSGMMPRRMDAVGHPSPSTSPSWEDVLSIEYSVRLLQIVIANALRSVSVAVEYSS